MSTSEGGLLAGQVDVRDQSTGAVRRAATDRRGRYRVLALGMIERSTGLYDVTARALGFAPQARTGVAVVLGERATLDFTLEHGPEQLTPIVIPATRRVDIARTDVATSVT